MNEFLNVIQLIQSARNRSLSAVNSELVNLYWQVGQYVWHKLQKARWGDGTVAELASFIAKNKPEIKGFDKRNIYRMCNFYELYKDELFVVPVAPQIQDINNETNAIVVSLTPQLQSTNNINNDIVVTPSPQLPDTELNELIDIRQTLLAKISWTHHLLLMERCKTAPEREFYLKLSIKEHYSTRELNRQISSSVYERVILGNAQLPESIKQLPQDLTNVLKDSYVFEFLNLPEPYIENDLRKALLREVKQFLLELGPDFLLVGEEYPLKVGKRDFRIDLLFFHRSIQCLIAFELKTDRFEPEYLGKTNFYLEALDRDVRKPHENPSIGVLLCKDKDQEVVEYALSRSLSPTMVSQYLTAMPDKKMLQQKIHELFQNHQL